LVFPFKAAENRGDKFAAVVDATVGDDFPSARYIVDRTAVSACACAGYASLCDFLSDVVEAGATPVPTELNLDAVFSVVVESSHDVSPQTCLVIFDFVATCAFDFLADVVERHPTVLMLAKE